MSVVVMLTLLFCSETLGSYPVFGEEDYTTFEFVGGDYNLSDMFMESDYGDWERQTGPLSPVNLTVDSVFNSSDSCNLTVTCSTYYFDINNVLKCDNKTCYQEGGEQTETHLWFTVSLHVYLSDGFIICNHSNTVNWTKDMIEIHHFCPQNAGSNGFSEGVSICMVKIVVFSVGLIIMVFAVISVHLIEKLQKQN